MFAIVLRKEFILLLLAQLFMTPCWAAITLVAGGQQQVPAGHFSTDIIFKVTDEVGHPQTNVQVEFSLRNLVDSNVVEGLTVNQAMTDLSGQVSTQLKATLTTGHYLLTAMRTDAPQFASSQMTVITGPAAHFNATSSSGNHSVPVGQASPEIVFKLTDAGGNPIAGQTVHFSLIRPSGQTTDTGLTPTTAVTDAQGEVRTRLEATQNLGNYTIVATTSNQQASTHLVVTAAAPSQLTVISGSEQIVPLGALSAKIVFQLTDTFNNPVIDQSIHFTLTHVDGTVATDYLFPQTAITDAQGQASTRLDAAELEQPGNYQLTAFLVNNQSITATLTLPVELIPDLPSLGFGQGVNPLGEPLTTTSSFYGGISVNGGPFEPEAVLTLNDSVAVKGLIEPEASHLNQIADIVIAAGYIPLPPFDTQEWFYMATSSNRYPIWSGDITELEPFMRDVLLTEQLIIHMYGGAFQLSGRLKIYLGYQLDNGNVFFNGQQTINVLIKE